MEDDVKDKMMKTSHVLKRRPPCLWDLKVVYLIMTTLEPSDWGQKTGSEQMKTEDEEDSQEIRKKTLSSGSKLLFICDATSEKTSFVKTSKLRYYLNPY